MIHKKLQNGSKVWCIRQPEKPLPPSYPLQKLALCPPHECTYADDILTCPGRQLPISSRPGETRAGTIYEPNPADLFYSCQAATARYVQMRLIELKDKLEAFRDEQRAFMAWMAEQKKIVESHGLNWSDYIGMLPSHEDKPPEVEAAT